MFHSEALRADDCKLYLILNVDKEASITTPQYVLPARAALQLTSSPSRAKLADRIEGDTMMSSLLNLSTLEVARTAEDNLWLQTERHPDCVAMHQFRGEDMLAPLLVCFATCSKQYLQKAPNTNETLKHKPVGAQASIGTM